MKKSKQKLPFLFRIWYACIYLLFGRGTLIYSLFKLDYEAGAYLPGHYTTSERYFVWCDYIHRRMMGKKITYSDVENEYLKKWNNEFNEAINNFNKNKK
jgi:hypothetical protein